jgi:aminodeoxyfutalosine synthase
VFDCKFCSYSRLLKQKEEGWELTIEQMLDIVRKYDGIPVTEVHIVGGVHPKMGLMYFAELIKKVKEIRPEIHVKAFTAVELDYMCRKAKVSYKEGLQILKDHGQDSLPGGGAEIFDEVLRAQIAGDKCTSKEWLEMHETAHSLGMPSNATMLYGHLENYSHRIDHMNRLRELQDKTNGFNTFIPLKFRNQGNQMSNVPEVSVIEDLKNYAVSRIFMDNFNHIKAYWPMIGRSTAQLSLNYGVDDIDGTIDDSTKIYSMAGSEEQNPALTTAELVELIKQVARRPIERDTVYNVIKDYSQESVLN